MRAKILIVEDDEMNRDMLSRRLQLHGYEIILAGDGFEDLAEGLGFEAALAFGLHGQAGIESLAFARELFTNGVQCFRARRFREPGEAGLDLAHEPLGIHCRNRSLAAIAAAPGVPQVAEGEGLEPPWAARPGSFQGSCLTS